MWELLDEYEKKFSEQFPLMLFRGVAESEIVSIIKACLKDNKPYEPELEEGAKY